MEKLLKIENLSAIPIPNPMAQRNRKGHDLVLREGEA